MPAKIIYHSGQSIGEHGCKYLGKSSKSGKGKQRGWFLCHCGNEFETRVCRVKTGGVKSCGCLGKIKYHYGQLIGNPD
jgi:hypothetical protein